jgi:hypothetical protein
MEWNGFYFPIYCSLFPIHTIVYLLHNITIHALRSQEFSAFSAFIKHLGVCIYTHTHTYFLFYPKNWSHLHRTEDIVPAVEASRYFIPSLTTKFPGFTIQKLPFDNSFYHRLQYSKWPDWSVLLAVSVSQLGLSVCLNPVRHHPCTSNGKMSPFPPCSQLC